MVTAADRFTTVYCKDYVAEKLAAPFKATPPGRSYTINDTDAFLNLRDELPAPQPGAIELANDFLEKNFRPAYPRLAERYFREPVQAASVEPNLRRDSIYAKDYGRPTKLPREMRDLDNVEFTSTMRADYGSPKRFGDVVRVLPVKQKCPLSEDHKIITSIVKVGGIDSEYEAVIGAMGKVFTEQHVHGKVTYPSLDAFRKQEVS